MATPSFVFLQARVEQVLLWRGTTPVPSIGESLELVETVSSNGRVRGKPQRHGFESHASSFIFYSAIVRIDAPETLPFMEK